MIWGEKKPTLPINYTIILEKKCSLVLKLNSREFFSNQESLCSGLDISYRH